MCFCCILVLDHTLLCRSIYLRGIPLGGLPTIFCRQQVSNRVCYKKCRVQMIRFLFLNMCFPFVHFEMAFSNCTSCMVQIIHYCISRAPDIFLDLLQDLTALCFQWQVTFPLTTRRLWWLHQWGDVKEIDGGTLFVLYFPSSTPLYSRALESIEAARPK